MSTVTSLEKRGRLVCIHLDERRFCTLDEKTFARFPLEMGEEVEAQEYMDRVSAFQMKNAWEYALSLLEVCDRTQRQVEDKLARRGVAPAAAEAVVSRLKEAGLIDDEAYARRVTQLEAAQAKGRYAVKRKLMQRGVAPEQAQQALSSLTREQQQQACLEAANKLYRRYRDDPLPAARRKLGQALARRGFAWEDIGSALERVLGQDEYED